MSDEPIEQHLMDSKGRKPMSMEWIRGYYDVPAKRGGRVEYTPCEGSKDKAQFGTITGVSGPHLRVRLDGERHSRPYHPTWQLRYLSVSPAKEGST